jgi:ribonucleoside-triphosphate reductase (formate)
VDIYNPSIRAQIITRRTYNRPLNNKGTKFETWEETIERVIQHQVWLWERAKCTKLTKEERHELERLRELMLVRKISMAGRTLWLGGTEL